MYRRSNNNDTRSIPAVLLCTYSYLVFFSISISYKVTHGFTVSPSSTSHIHLQSSTPIRPNFVGFNSVVTETCIHTSSTSSKLYYSQTNNDQVKRVGGGIATISTGDCLLFDPNKEGKLQGTDTLQARINQASSYVHVTSTPITTSTSATPPDGVTVQPAEHWLEYLDDNGNVPLNFAKNTNPVSAQLLARARIISPDAPGDIQHIILKLPSGMHYVEGQSLSVIPPGIDPKTNKNYAPRLYSIASTRYGDILDGSTVSLCVRRAEYYNPDTGLPDPSKKGVCSNYLCDASPGTMVSVAGPVGKTMLLPSDPNVDVIMVATGTGIAPFRAFLHRMFVEETVRKHLFNGCAWLVLGVPTTGGLLYKDEIDFMLENARPGQLKVNYAISREMKNDKGGKLYVQDVIDQNAQEFFDRLDNGAVVYFCGLKGMMPPILETLQNVANRLGVNWDEKLKTWKANHQWHVEVY